MLFANVKETLEIEGVMPERALLRLKRAGISLYHLQKTRKNAILFRVKRKDIQKVFAIYPNVCYNRDSYSPYTLRRKGGVGIAKVLDFCKNRAGFCLGGLAFLGCILASDNLVLGVSVVGNTPYVREARIALAENGIKPFALYPKEKRDTVTAKLLSLQGVEFCSVQKKGSWVVVELQKADLSFTPLQRGDLVASRSGVIDQICVLKGTPQKKVGDTVAVGEVLVEDYIEGKEGEQVSVEVVARVKIACEYEQSFPNCSEEEGFAQAYLALGETGDFEIARRELSQTEEGVSVKISYTVLQTINF